MAADHLRTILDRLPPEDVAEVGRMMADPDYKPAPRVSPLLGLLDALEVLDA